MNQTFDRSTQAVLWMDEYDQQIAAGTSIELLICQLNEQLQIVECKHLCENPLLENFAELEQFAKKTIDYDARLSYLESKRKIKVK